MKYYRSIGVTGSRAGLTPAQRVAAMEVRLELDYRGAMVLHHGDCVGADKQFALLGRRFGWKLVSHPPIKSTYRAFIPSDQVHPAESYLDRNLAIVLASDILIAFPKDDEPQDRGGTWHTIRCARQPGAWIPTVIVWPDGHLSEDEGCSLFCKRDD